MLPELSDAPPRFCCLENRIGVGWRVKVTMFVIHLLRFIDKKIQVPGASRWNGFVMRFKGEMNWFS